MSYTEEPKVVTFGDAARHLASTPRAIKGMVKSGLLIGVKLPGRIRYSGVTMESLNKLLSKSLEPQKEVGGK